MDEQHSNNISANFAPKTKEIISWSRDVAIMFHNDYISEDHLMYAIIEHVHSKILFQLGFAQLEKIKIQIQTENKDVTLHKAKNQNSLPLTKTCEKIIRISVLEAKGTDDKEVKFVHFILSILKVTESKLSSFLRANNIIYDDVRSNYIANQFEFNDSNFISDVPVKNERNNTTNKSNNSENIIDYINFLISPDINATLNVEEEANEFAQLLNSLSFDQGMMVGLFGKWGRGKTFFWKKVWENLNNKKNNSFYKVEYHAWKYQDTPASWAYLYENIANTYLDKPASNWDIIKRFEYFCRLLKLNFKRKGYLPLVKFLLMLLIGAGVTTTLFAIKTNREDFKTLLNYIGIPFTILATFYKVLKYLKKEYSSNAKDLFESYSKKLSFKEQLGIQAEIQKEIENVLQAWIPKKSDKRVIVFVDDIDRCSEEKIIEIIDSLRIMLDNEKIYKRLVVVTAVDESVLKRVIAKKYSNLIVQDKNDKSSKSTLKSLVREYMDKLFIAGIRLNTLSTNERRDILASITLNKIKSFENQKNQKNVAVLNTYRKSYIQSKENSEPTGLVNTRQIKFNEVNYEIDEIEYNYLSELLKFYEDATPRTIRIFYYRFLLAKKFVLYNTKISPDFQKLWYDNDIDKSILPYLIFYYTSIGPDSIHKDLTEIYQPDNDLMVSIMLFDKSYKVPYYLLNDLLKIVEIVVPY